MRLQMQAGFTGSAKNKKYLNTTYSGPPVLYVVKSRAGFNFPIAFLQKEAIAFYTRKSTTQIEEGSYTFYEMYFSPVVGVYH